MEKNSYWEIIAKHLSKEATSVEEGQLTDWLKADPEHQKVFEEIKQNWLSQERTISKFDLARGKQLITSKIKSSKVDKNNQLPYVKHSLESKSDKFSIIKIAASIVLIACLALASYFVLTPPPTISFTEKTNPAGKISKVGLSDGTVIWLNTASTILYPKQFTGDTREIYLSGEAFFEVQQDQHKPFIVHTGQVSTHVLGTSFNITAFDDNEDITVTVASGKVSVRDSTGVIGELIKDHQISYNRITGKSSRQVVESDDWNSWREGRLVFTASNYGEVAEKLEKWFDVVIDFENKAIKTCPITASFEKGEDLKQVLYLLSILNGSRYKFIEENHIVISGNGCSQ